MDDYRSEEDINKGCYGAIERMIIIRTKSLKRDLKDRKNSEIRQQIHDTIKAIREERMIINEKLIK